MSANNRIAKHLDNPALNTRSTALDSIEWCISRFKLAAQRAEKAHREQNDAELACGFDHDVASPDEVAAVQRLERWTMATYENKDEAERALIRAIRLYFATDGPAFLPDRGPTCVLTHGKETYIAYWCNDDRCWKLTVTDSSCVANLDVRAAG